MKTENQYTNAAREAGQSVNTHFSDGTASVNSSTREGAHQAIADRYGVAVSDLVTEQSDERELVWLDEETAANDDGAKAVAEIRRANRVIEDEE